MRRPSNVLPFLALAAAGLLAGCGGDTARTFGLTRDAPDEFQVTTRAPLSMPPSLAGDLPVPRPGATRPQELSQRQAAETALVPGAALGPAGSRRQTGGESAFLSAAGRPVGDNVRRQVDEEALRLEQPNRSFTDRLMFWRDPPPPGVQLDARQEAQRLRENAALGRDTGAGETPIIQRQRGRSFIGDMLEGLF